MLYLFMPAVFIGTLYVTSVPNSRQVAILSFNAGEIALLIHVQARYLSPKTMMGVVMGVESFFSSFMTIRVIDNAA